MKRKAPVFLTVSLLLCGGGPAAAQSFDHSQLDTVLARYAHNGRVDYAALKVGRAALDAYLERVAAVPAEEVAGWPEAEQVAFYINAYNACVLQTVIDNYPIDVSFFKKLTHPRRLGFPNNSIRQIDGALDGIKHVVAGRETTLDQLQQGTLRSTYSEPRIHFALVDAALSSPPLRGEAYRGGRLDAQLDEQGRQFMGDPRLNRVEIDRRQVQLSRIFDWFGEDFRGYAQSGTGYRGDEKLNGVLRFVSRYVRGRAADFLATGDYGVKYLDFDWTLNDQAIAAAQ